MCYYCAQLLPSFKHKTMNCTLTSEHLIIQFSTGDASKTNLMLRGKHMILQQPSGVTGSPGYGGKPQGVYL